MFPGSVHYSFRTYSGLELRKKIVGIKKKIVFREKKDNNVLCCARLASTTAIGSEISVSTFMI